MPLKIIFPQVYALELGPVNLFLIDDGPQRLTLIDTGYAESEQPISEALRAIGRQPEEIAQIIVTHCHPDHAGSLAALKRISGAPAWMHAADAAVVRGEQPMVRSTPAPGLHNQILYRIFIKNVPPRVPVAAVEHELIDGQILPIGGGLRVIHTPGHSAGHTALLLERDGGLLFVGDACSNLPWVSYSIVYDDLAEGRRSLARLAALQPHTICFGHGRPLSGAATRAFHRAWAGEPRV